MKRLIVEPGSIRRIEFDTLAEAERHGWVGDRSYGDYARDGEFGEFEWLVLLADLTKPNIHDIVDIAVIGILKRISEVDNIVNVHYSRSLAYRVLIKTPTECIFRLCHKSDIIEQVEAIYEQCHLDAVNRSVTI